MLIAKKTLYRDWSGDYQVRYKNQIPCRDWFLCGQTLWEIFPIASPEPKVIRIELHTVPAKDRVVIAHSPYTSELWVDDVEYVLFYAAYQWLRPYLEKHGTVYGEVWA